MKMHGLTNPNFTTLVYTCSSLDVLRQRNAISTLRVTPSYESIFLLHYGPGAKSLNALTGKQASI